MLIYLIFFTFLGSLAIIEFFNSNLKANSWLFFAVAFIFLLFIGLRKSGYDFLSYLGLFNYIKVNGAIENLEIGYVFLNKLAPSYSVLLLAMAFLTVITNIVVIRRLSSMPYLSYFFLCGTLLLATYMGQMRQGLAIGLVMYAFYFYNSKRYYLSVTAFFIAILFHTSAALGLLFLFLPKRKLNIVIYLIIIIIGLFTFQYLGPVLSGYIDVLGPGLVGEKLAYYSDVDEEKLGINSTILIRILFFLVGYYSIKKVKLDFFPWVMNIYFMSILFYLYLGFIPQLGGRGALYFACFDTVIVGAVVFYNRGLTKALLFSGFFLLTILRIVMFFSSEFKYESYVPYLQYEFLIR